MAATTNTILFRLLKDIKPRASVMKQTYRLMYPHLVRPSLRKDVISNHA